MKLHKIFGHMKDNMIWLLVLEISACLYLTITTNV